MSHKKTVPIGINQRANDRFLSDISQTPGGTIWGTTPGGKLILIRNVVTYTCCRNKNKV